MPKPNIDLLIAIAKKAEIGEEFSITTTKLSKELGMSQQSVSRKLRELEETGFIKREPTPDGIKIKAEKKAIQELEYYLDALNKIFRQPAVKNKKKELKGRVVAGMGEGRFYTELSGYKKQFIEKLAIKPFPGTLNLWVDEKEKELFLKSREAIIIHGFKAKERTYGQIIAFMVKVAGEKQTAGKKQKSISAALIVPQRTHHNTNIAEIICEKNLRKSLELNNSSEVIIK